MILYSLLLLCDCGAAAQAIPTIANSNLVQTFFFDLRIDRFNVENMFNNDCMMMIAMIF